MVGGGRAQGRDARGVGGAARVLRYCAQGRNDSGGRGAGRPRRSGIASCFYVYVLQVLF
jgi:hypothetical protein